MKKFYAVILAAMMVMASTLGAAAQTGAPVFLGYMNDDADMFMVGVMEVEDSMTADLMASPLGGGVFLDEFDMLTDWEENSIAYHDDAKIYQGEMLIVIPEAKNADGSMIAYAGQLDFTRGEDDGVLMLVSSGTMVYVFIGYETELDAITELIGDVMTTGVLPADVDDFESMKIDI